MLRSQTWSRFALLGVTCERAANPLTALGYSSLGRTSVAGGGCACSGTVKQTGGLGWISPAPSTESNYTLADNVITNSDDTKYSYGVSGSKLTMIPQSTNPAVTGTIVLQKSGSTGSGGTTRSGGGGDAGATSGSGGTSTSGGRSGSGGRKCPGRCSTARARISHQPRAHSEMGAGC